MAGEKATYEKEKGRERRQGGRKYKGKMTAGRVDDQQSIVYTWADVHVYVQQTLADASTQMQPLLFIPSMCMACLQDPLAPGSQANTFMQGIRKRKGLTPGPKPLSEYEDKL